MESEQQSFDQESRKRGSIGTWQVWDDETRAAHRKGGRDAPAPRRPAIQLPDDPLVQLVARAITGIVESNLPSLAPHTRQRIATELALRISAHLFGSSEDSSSQGPSGGDDSRPEDPATEPTPTRATEPDQETVDQDVPVPAPPCLDHVDPVLARSLRSDLSRLGAGIDGMEEIREYALALILEEVAEERRRSMVFLSASPALEDEADPDTIDRLERRVNKLTLSLQTTRNAVQMLNELEDYDPGLKSIFRNVQGLDPADFDYEFKLEMLTEVFEANLELQKHVLAGRMRFRAGPSHSDRSTPADEHRVA